MSKESIRTAVIWTPIIKDVTKILENVVQENGYDEIGRK